MTEEPAELATTFDELPAAPTPIRELLAFVVAGEAYAFPLEHIREILRYRRATPVPRAQEQVLGILSVRGQVTTVVDMRRALRMEETPPTRQTRILLIDEGEEVVGVVVDRVLQVFRLHTDEIEVASTVSGDLSEYVIGIGRPRERGRSREGHVDLLILLDPTSLLASTTRGGRAS